MAAPWYCAADELIKAGWASITVTYVLMRTVVLLEFDTIWLLSGSVVDMHPDESQFECKWYILNSFFDINTILYTSRMKAPGSNPLNNSRRVGISQYDNFPSLLYLWLFYV